MNSSRDVSYQYFFTRYYRSRVGSTQSDSFRQSKDQLFLHRICIWNGSTDVAATQKQQGKFREFLKEIGGYNEIKKCNLDVVFARF